MPILSSPEARAKSLETRRARKAARDNSPLRTDFAEAETWLDLARKNAVRLPPWGDPITRTLQRHWFHRLAITQADYLDWIGEKDLDGFARKNPLWPARAWVGILLEQFGQA